MIRIRPALVVLAMLGGLMPTASMAEWGQHQCLGAARICRANCQHEARSCYAGCRNDACRQRCGAQTHNCIYVRCDTQACFKLR